MDVQVEQTNHGAAEIR